jgi:hypothetical protein
LKFSALQLERLPVFHVPAVVPPLSVDKGRLLMRVRTWGSEFLTRVGGQELAEKVRQQLSRFEALRPQAQDAVTEKLTSVTQETPRQTQGAKLTPAVEEMAQKLRQRRDESIAKKEKTAQRQKVSQTFRPAPPAQRQGPRMSM